MGSEFREAFNFHLLKLTEHGILKRIYNRWPDTSRNEEFGITEAAVLGFENLLFPFSALAMGMAAAVVLAALEGVQRKMTRLHRASH